MAQQQEPWPKDSPITENEMRTCTEVMNRLHKADKRFKLFDAPNCRELRKALGPFSRHQQDAMFGGEGRTEYEQKKQVCSVMITILQEILASREARHAANAADAEDLDDEALEALQVDEHRIAILLNGNYVHTR